MSKFIICICFFCFLFGCNDPRSEREKLRDSILNQLAKQMQKKGLIAIGSGGGCTLDKKINLISMTFTYQKVMNMPEARELIVECIQTLLDLMNANPDNNQYFEKFPATEDIMLISILGQTCPTDLQCVEVVKIIKGTIYYNINHPLPHLGHIYLTLKEESLEEAQKILKSGSNEEILFPGSTGMAGNKI